MKIKKLILIIFAVFLSLLFVNLVSADVWDGLNAYYNFEEASGNLIDITGNGWHGTLYNGVTQGVTGKIGNAYKFDGIDDYIEIGNDALPDGNGNFTISLWVKMDSIDRYNTFISKPQSTNDDFTLYSASTNTNILWFRESKLFKTTETNDAGVWYHIVLVKNGTNFTFYRNGVNLASNTSSDAVLDAPVWLGRSLIGEYLNGTMDELGIWTRALTEEEISLLYNNGDGLVFRELAVTLNYPQDFATLTTTNILFNASYLITGYNLINATLYIWNSTSLFATNTTNITGTSNETIWNITNFEIGNYEWNVYACGNNSTGYVKCDWAPSNYTFSIGATVNSISYNNETYETASETFQINISVIEGYTPTNGFLVYDGVEYEADIENIEGNNYSISATMDIPTETGDKDFYFKWNLGSFTQYTNNYTQTINPVVFGLCNSSLTIPYLNISFKDEKDLTSINGTIDFDVYYYLGSGTTYKTLHYTNNTENPNYSFCFSPDDKLVNVNGTIIFSSSNYWERRISFDEIYTSSTTQKTLYLLSYDDGSWAKFQVLSSSTAEALSGVTVTFYRDFGSGNEVIIKTQTDDVGMSASWIDPDYTYLITFEKEGYITGSYNMQISDSNVRYIYLAAAVGAEEGWNYTNISSFSYQTYPPATINLIPNQNYAFGIYLVSGGSELNVSMDLYCNDTLIYSDYDVNNVVNLSYNFNVSNCYQIKTVYTVSTSNGEDSITLLSFYSVYNILVGDLSLYSFLTAFDDYDFGVIGRWFKFVIALFIVITVAGVFYKLGGIDSLDSAITSIVAILVVIWIFSYVGWLSLGATWIAKYSIALLTSILGGVFIIWKLTAS